MRKIYVLSLLLITACVPPYQSPHEQITKKCTDAGYERNELDNCISAATVAYNNELEKQRNEAIKAKGGSNKTPARS